MKSSLLAVALGLVASASALRIPVKRVKTGARFHATTLSSTGPDDNNLGNVQDERYVANITVNGLDVLVLLDTGSTDLWIYKPGQLSSFNDTGLKADMRFGDGSAHVTGPIGIGSFEFGSYSVPQQAFVNADSVTVGLVTELGIEGLLGLGFDTKGFSVVNDAIVKKFGKDATWGQSVLANIFAQNPALPNFIGISLSRTDDLEGTADGSFTISEVDDDYPAVTSAPRLQQFPKDSGRWGTLLEGLTVDGKQVTIKSGVRSAPKGSAVVVFDTGTPTAILPEDIVTGIYSNIPGAIFSKDDNFWVLPCNTTSSVVATFGGQQFPIHPLDLSEIGNAVVGGQNVTFCFSTYQSAAGIGDSTFDGLLGDSWMRNVYTIFDFGDTDTSGKPTSPAFMQLLSQTDASKAAADVVSVRAKTLAGLPAELPPAELFQLLANSPSASSSDASAATTTDNTDSAVARYGPWVVGLLGANVLIGLLLVALGVATCVKRGATSGPTRAADARYVPVKFKDDAPRPSGQYDVPYGQ